MSSLNIYGMCAYYALDTDVFGHHYYTRRDDRETMLLNVTNSVSH